MNSDNKKRMLMIFYRPPFPLIGGDKIRMFQNLKILSSSYNIDVIFINDKVTDKSVLDNVLKYAKNVEVFEFKKLMFYWLTLIGFLLNKRPLQVNYYYFKKVQNWVDKNISNYDIVFCHTIRAAEYVKNKQIEKVIDFVDAISMNYEKAAKKTKFGIWNLLYNIDKTRVLKYELEQLRVFNKKIIVSDIDRDYILKNAGFFTNLNVVQNAVDIKPSNFKDTKEEDYIVFVGKMDYEPNVSAVVYFSTKVFPKILERFSNLKFYIVGVHPTNRVKALSKKRNIEVLGYIENLDNITLRAKLVVAPMISGAGIQNKILMAMTLGKCVITTEIGAEGLNNLEQTNNKPLEIAATTEDFIATTIELLQDDTKRHNMGNSAKNYIKNHFSFNKVAQELLAVINKESK